MSGMLRIFRSSFRGCNEAVLLCSPSPFPVAEILDSLCQDFLPRNVSAILYLTNSELFGRSTASSQYFLQLGSYLGIPVVAWNADNSGLERRVSCIAERLCCGTRTVLDMYHTLHHLQTFPTELQLDARFIVLWAL